MLTFLTWIHVVVALVLIFFVLLQDPKGGGAMGVFGGGGGSNSLLGSTGAGNFFTQVTKGAAILFAILCIGMTYLISHPSQSVLDKMPANAVVPQVPDPGIQGAPVEQTAPVEKPATAVPPETK